MAEEQENNLVIHQVSQIQNIGLQQCQYSIQNNLFYYQPNLGIAGCLENSRASFFDPGHQVIFLLTQTCQTLQSQRDKSSHFTLLYLAVELPAYGSYISTCMLCACIKRH